MNKQSSTVRYLQGKIYPGTNSPVKDITAKGNTRIVHLRDGTMVKQTKKQLVKNFHEVLKDNQLISAKRSMRTNPDGTVSATVGGTIMGERKTYLTKGRAVAALEKRYGNGNKT